jgi:hypothetical protein
MGAFGQLITTSEKVRRLRNKVKPSRSGSTRRRRGKQPLGDERVLGSGDFVERIIEEAEARIQRQYSERQRGRKVERLVAEECKKRKVSLTELRSGSRRGAIPAVRATVSRN